MTPCPTRHRAVGQARDDRGWGARDPIPIGSTTERPVALAQRNSGENPSNALKLMTKLTAHAAGASGSIDREPRASRGGGPHEELAAAAPVLDVAAARRHAAAGAPGAVPASAAQLDDPDATPAAESTAAPPPRTPAQRDGHDTDERMCAMCGRRPARAVWANAPWCGSDCPALTGERVPDVPADDEPGADEGNA
jgi:hypothetical protein